MAEQFRTGLQAEPFQV
jgi:hypothetical protein